MPLQLFEWLYLIGVILDVGIEAVIRPSADRIVGAIVAIALVSALIWLASRKGQVWAAWLLAAFAALSVVVVISYYTGGLPYWLSWLRPAKPPTPVQTVLDTISALMQVAAMLFYFSAGKARA